MALHLDAENVNSYLGSGTTWSDIRGNGNHGTLQKGVAFTNVNNGAMVFDGVNDYFVTNNNLDLSNTDKLTIQIILKTASSNTQMIMEHSVNYNNNAFAVIARPLLQFLDKKTELNVTNASTSTNDNNWHLITTTADRSLGANQNQIYIDGITSSGINDPSLNNDISGNYDSHKLFLASRAGSSLYFNGAIAQVLIYNRVLTAAEIDQNYNVVKSKYGL